ncbi:MAG: N-acetylneuraminate synthase [Rickettsiales bacterium]
MQILHGTYIIAEAGVNHNGSEEKAIELVDIAVAAGANAVKFQAFAPEALVTKSAATAHYQAKNLSDDSISQYEMLERLKLPEGALVRINKYCKKQNIDFLCTPFDNGSLDYLVKNTSMPYLKLSSGEITNGHFLLAAARTGVPIILSTGMSNIYEIGEALSVLYYGYNYPIGYPRNSYSITPLMLTYLRSKVTLLHCVSQYPASITATNLKAIDTLRDIFGLRVGLSDHSLGINMAIAAVARGASVIEKHFTYDLNAVGPDHAASLSPSALKDMVSCIREVELGIGNGEKTCQPEEEDTRIAARRSVVASVAINKGTVFSEKNIACKRPSTGGISPNRFWDLLGKEAKFDYAADDFIGVVELQ